jgi:hypothetical protein
MVGDLLQESTMKRTSVIGQCVLVAASALLLQSLPALADEPSRAASAGAAQHSRGFDWVQHTQHTLDELKVKLNLVPEQTAAWDTWSGGVMKDARQQLEQKKERHEEKAAGGKAHSEPSTPERMARAIESLRAQTNWMQEHLVQLEAAQVRTKVFYDRLDTNQKTIFDLFWHEVHHRAAGHDDDGDAQEHGSFGPGDAEEGHDGRAGAY